VARRDEESFCPLRPPGAARRPRNSPVEGRCTFERYGKDGENAGLKMFAGKVLPHLRGHLRLTQDLQK
jgi:hypothetical protein